MGLYSCTQTTNERTFVFGYKVLDVLGNVLVEVELSWVQGLADRPLVEEQHPRVTSNLQLETQLYKLYMYEH